jgi:hypothetical protein
LERVVGKETLERLMPGLDRQAPAPSSKYDVYSDDLNADRIAILRNVLSPTGEGYRERPLNYIKSVRILDEAGQTILRGGDHNTFMLFDLPDAERAALVDAYRRRGIPETVIEQVEVDVQKLDP